MDPQFQPPQQPQPQPQPQQPQPTPPPAPSPLQTPPPAPEAPKGGKGLAITGFVLGIVSLVFSFFVFLSVPLAIAALIMTIIALAKKRPGKGLSIAGLAISGTTLILMIPLTLITIVSYNGITARANTSSAESSASSVLKQAEFYYSEMGSYPTSESALTESDTFNYLDGIEFTAFTTEPASPTTVRFESCGGTGAQVYYWDYEYATWESDSVGTGC